LEWEKSIW